MLNMFNLFQFSHGGCEVVLWAEQTDRDFIIETQEETILRLRAMGHNYS